MYFVASYWDKRKLSQMVRYGFLQWSLWVYLPSIGFPTKKDESFMLITHHVLYVYVPYSYLNTVKTSATFFFPVSNHCAHCRMFQASVFHMWSFFQLVSCTKQRVVIMVHSHHTKLELMMYSYYIVFTERSL